jgi:signal transduction histidine kinase
MNAATELTHLSVTSGDAMLRRVAESVRVVTQARCAYVVHRLMVPTRVQVMAVAGVDGPEPGSRMPAPSPDPPRRITVPLTLDGAPMGAIVADDVADPLSTEARRELAGLAGLGALALHNHLLILEAERQSLRQARRHFHLLSGTVYHLKNAIAVVSEYLELLELEGELTERQREFIERSRRSGVTAMRLLTELHELGRTDAGAQVPRPEPINVLMMIRDLLREYALAAGRTGVRFDLDATDAPPLETDPDCVRQILDNLLANAVRYSPPDGLVTVRASVRTGRRATDPRHWLRIDVVDMGPGVSEGDAVFDEALRMERKGAPGFRLAISRRVARLLGGDLTLETAPGAGSTFSLWLPLSTP